MNGRVAIFRRRYVDTNRRRRAVLRRPITVDVPVVDIAVELLAPTVEQTADVVADPPVVDVAVEVLAVDGAKIVDVPVVDIATEILAVDPAQFVEVDTVDITVTPVQVTPGGVAPPVDLSVQVLPVDTAKIVDVPTLGDVPLALRNGPIYDEAGTPAAVGGFIPGQLGPSGEPIYRVQRSAGVPVGWGVFIAADLVGPNIPTGTAVKIGLWARASTNWVDPQIVDDPGVEQVANPPGAAGSPTVWTYYEYDVTTEREWIAGTHRLRGYVGEADTKFAEWSDPVVSVQSPRVEVLPVDLAKIVDVPVVDIAAQVNPVGVFISDTRPVEIDVEVLPVTVAYGKDDTAAVVGIPITPPVPGARVLAQNIRTNQWVHLDLPVSELEITKTVSGPEVITGVFPAEIRDLADVNLEPWGTWIYVEENDQIRATGILQPTKADQGQKLMIEAVGFSTYPHGLPFLGNNPNGIQVDPADMVRHIWAHLQSYPDGNLGVEVVGSTPAKIGETEPPEQVEFVTGDGQQVSFQSGGPYTLHWYEAPDCGSEIDDLAKEAPFEYIERSFWNNPATKDYVRKQIVIMYPRAGRRRDDLVFDQDENLLQAIGPEETPGTYASQIILLGKGEGTSKIRGYAGRTLGTRLRRVAVIDKKTVDSTVRANALCTEELERRQALLDITELVVKARHPYARIGSYEAGDDVKVKGTVPWAGYVDQWERILSFTYSPGQERVRVATRRSEWFDYGGE